MNYFKLYHIGYKLYLAVGFEKMSIQLRKTVKRFTRRTKIATDYRFYKSK